MKKVTNIFQTFLLTCFLILAIGQVAQANFNGDPHPFPGTNVDMGGYEYQSMLPSLTITCPANLTADVDVGICCAALSIAAPTVSGDAPPLLSPMITMGQMTPAIFISQEKPSSLGQLPTTWATPSAVHIG